jgi:hypothetical protein
MIDGIAARRAMCDCPRYLSQIHDTCSPINRSPFLISFPSTDIVTSRKSQCGSNADSMSEGMTGPISLQNCAKHFS